MVSHRCIILDSFSLAKDFPSTPYAGVTLKRLAALGARPLAVMHGSSFRGETRRAILELASALKGALGKAGMNP